MTASRGGERRKTHTVNKMIDSIFHPLAKNDPRFWVLDWVSHAVYELSVGIPPNEVYRRWSRYGGYDELARLIRAWSRDSRDKRRGNSTI